MVVSSKDKKARHIALRDFLIAIPGTLDRAITWFGWLVVLAGITLAALVLHLVLGRGGPPAMLPPGGHGDNPSGALFVRDLERLPDGRHTFDLVYELVLHNETERPFSVVFTRERLLIGDAPAAADVVDLGHAPGVSGAPTGAWHEAISRSNLAPGQPIQELRPGRWRVFRVHYRINARPDQFADVAIGYALNFERRGWFGHGDNFDADGHDEEVQLGAVLRAHCPLGVKVQNGDLKSLCAS
jgi:hypothetical protein